VSASAYFPSPGRGDRKPRRNTTFLPPHPGLESFGRTSFPQLALWATFACHSVADTKPVPQLSFMAHTFTHLLTHIVFSTKDRAPLLDAELKSRLFPYLGGIIRAHDGKALIINGPADHVHILASLAAKHSLSDLMRELKADSTGWVHKNVPNQKAFAWQIGYGAFSVSHSNLAEVEKYIANQEEHHKRMSFQEEFVAFLKKHEIQYDEKYLWE
jgi:putative transposase